jgi:two-component system response regulator HydG
VLQEGAFRRVGEQEERTADVRVISTSLHDLARLVDEQRFREDLYYRLNVVVVRVPPLRERPEEIPDLIQHFLEQAEAVSTAVSPAAMNLLLRYRWPGNVRELHNELLRASALSDGQITPESLSPKLQEPAAEEAGRGADQESLGAAVAAAERGAILRALDQTDGSVTQAAKLLGISRVVLHRKLRKHGIRRQPRPVTFSASA